MLDKLQTQDRRIFEYWSHAAAYLPMDDYRFSLPRMQAFAAGEIHWFKKDRKVMQRVLDHIRQEGPAMSKDFKPPPGHKPGTWWHWKPTKIALEQLFMEGKLMVVRRNNFQKVYDLAERVLPPQIDTTMPDTTAYCRHIIRRATKAHGIVTDTEIGYLRKRTKTSLRNEVKKMVGEGEIVSVQIEELPNTYYSTESILNTLPKIRVRKNVHILSPFDNAIIQRKRTKELFDFDYQIECYVPAAKRIHGYFSLPILWGEQFIGRVDTKADRSTKRLLLRNLVFEENFNDYENALPLLATKFQAFAQFNGCDEIVCEKARPERALEEMRKALKQQKPFPKNRQR